MNVSEIADLLPEEPRLGMAEWVEREYEYQELGGEFLSFKRVPVAMCPEFKRLMTADDYEYGSEHHWGAECRCTACGESFITGYSTGTPHRELCKRGQT